MHIQLSSDDNTLTHAHRDDGIRKRRGNLEKITVY